MGTEYTFYDYVDGDGDGANLIKNWLNSAGKPAKARFTMLTNLLEASPPGGMEDSVWKKPYAFDLAAPWDGFTELRAKVNKVQYRLIGKKQDRSVLLVTWAIHGGKGWHPDIPPKTAAVRVSQMIANPEKYRREHEL